MDKQQILSDEHRDELLHQIEVARKMRELVRLPAWTEILEPAIVSRRDSLLSVFKTKKFETLNEVISIQQGIDALENLLDRVYGYITAGEEASEILKNQVK